MAVAIISWVQVQEAVPVAQVTWVQVQEAPPTVRVYWLQLDGSPVITPVEPPSVVTGSATGATTSTIEWTPAATGSTPVGFDVQYEAPSGSGTWVTAVGDANPTTAGVISFDVTNQTPAMLVTPRVRAIQSGGGVSDWTVGSPYYLDNSAEGDGPFTAVATISWLLIDDAPVITPVEPPSVVTGSATGATTSTIEWTPAATGSTPVGFDVQYEAPSGSGTWVTAVGDANPTTAGVISFDVTNQTPAMLVTPRVRAIQSGGGVSDWTVGSPYYLNNSAEGGVSFTPYTATHVIIVSVMY